MYPEADFTASIFVLNAILLCVSLGVHDMLTDASMCLYVAKKKAEMSKERQGKCVSHSTLGSAHSHARQMIRNGFY